MTHIFDCALIFLADPIIVHKKRQDWLSYCFVFSLSAQLHYINIQSTSWLMRDWKGKEGVATWFLVLRHDEKFIWNILGIFCWFRNRDYNRRQTLRFVGIAWCMLIFMCNVMCNYHDHFLNLLIFLFLYTNLLTLVYCKTSKWKWLL